MTDKEIIKALRCCKSESLNSCRECQYSIEGSDCSCLLSNDALDLINRQQEEIERLTKRNIKNCRNWQRKYYSLRAKAIKEFAERFKQIAGIYQKDTFVIGVDEFDNLVKETVGED